MQAPPARAGWSKRYEAGVTSRAREVSESPTEDGFNATRANAIENQA